MRSTDRILQLDLREQPSYKNSNMNNADDYIREHIRAEGRVQGVGFRFWTLKHAQRLGLGGEVFNMPDGSVEAVFCGGINTIEEMIQLCSKGPACCCVVNLETVSRVAIAMCPESFIILR